MRDYNQVVPPSRKPKQDNGDGKDTIQTTDYSPKTWLEVLPSPSGTVLAALLANIMTDGLTPNQQNILGNFVSSVGTLISYIAAREG